jgi:AraC family transcriptional regulator, transcriptional activator of the genes for pyochelin and ferripyochelin receptors
MKPVQYLTNQNYSIDSYDLLTYRNPQQNCLHQSLPDEVGEGKTTIFELNQHMSYIETHYLPSKDLSILSRIDHQEPRLVVTLGLKGHSRFDGYPGDEVVFKQGYTTITAFKSSNGERRYLADKPVSQLRFSISKHWLDTFLGDKISARLFNKNETQVISHRPISAQGMTSAKQLTSGNIVKELHVLFIQGHTMTLLAAELAHLFEQNHHTTETFNQKDKAMAELARDILYHEFKNPPSVAELSSRVGTNQFKLKRMFHHFFNNTPYGLLSEFRMNHAYRLLESKQCHVTVVADQVGFKHASNFTAAFIKHFGITPKSVARKS